jgi:FtsP/CotA-like multicopper oxidase with cupredoxin domain
MARRRTFLAYCGGTTLGLLAQGRFGVQEVLAAVPGGTLDPAQVPKYVSALLVPPVMPRAGSVMTKGGRSADYYEVSMRQFTQQVLPAGWPATTVWGYGPARAAARDALLLHHAPSLTIEARWGQPTIVKWINDLRGADGRFLPHLLPVDPTLHWANPPGGEAGRDSSPRFDATPAPYQGPVPIVTHVHGAVAVGDESDGYAEAWFLPAATNLPAGWATSGSWYDFFKAKAAAEHGLQWEAGSATSRYPNDQRAGALWYHDHALGMTRLNVYAGPAGFYFIRGGPAGDKAVLDSRTGLPARLPGPSPIEGDRFPPNKPYREIPVAIQDRSFNADGSLFYPDSRAFFDGIAGPYSPGTDLPPIWNPEFFGNFLIANGSTWPYLALEQRRYRLRLLNGCQSRFLVLDFSAVPGLHAWQIGHEGGFLERPVDLASTGGLLVMAPAERADIIADFTDVPVGAHVLRNRGPDEPYAGGQPGIDFEPADPATTGAVLQFRVGPASAGDTTTPPQFLKLPPIAELPATAVTRRLVLLEQMSMYFADAPAMAMLGLLEGNPAVAAAGSARLWSDDLTENPEVGAVETWELYNLTGDAHPMHIHEVAFQVMGRQALQVDDATGVVRLAGAPMAPGATETGYKDVVIAYPGQVVRVRMRFARAGQFTWHCHIVEHEDNEMMRPLRVGPVQAGQPVPTARQAATAHARKAWLSAARPLLTRKSKPR